MDIWVEQEFAKREAGRIARAKQLYCDGLTESEIAMDLFHVADAVARSRVRDLLRERT